MLTDLTELTKEVRDETGVELDKVRSYSRFMFKMVSDTMKAGEYESVSLQYLGKFHVKPARLLGLVEKGVVLNEKGTAIVEQFRKNRDEYNR